MGRIGKVIKSFIDKLSGSGTNAQFSSVEEFSGDQRTAQIFGSCNEDFAPPESCMTFDQSLGSGRGYLVSIAYHNQLIPPVAIHGERRLFSTNKAGDTVMSEMFLKQNGTILIKNDNASITITPAGEINIISTGNTNINSAKTFINNDVEIDGKLKVLDLLTADNGISGSGNLNLTGIITGAAVFNGKDSDDHLHGGVTVGGGNTGVPV